MNLTFAGKITLRVGCEAFEYLIFLFMTELHLCLMEKLQDALKQKQVVLRWVPGHCGIPGNKRVNELAKLGARGEQPNNSASFMEKKTLIKAVFRPHMRGDDYQLLD